MTCRSDDAFLGSHIHFFCVCFFVCDAFSFVVDIFVCAVLAITQKKGLACSTLKTPKTSIDKIEPHENKKNT